MLLTGFYRQAWLSAYVKSMTYLVSGSLVTVIKPCGHNIVCIFAENRANTQKFDGLWHRQSHVRQGQTETQSAFIRMIFWPNHKVEFNAILSVLKVRQCAGRKQQRNIGRPIKDNCLHCYCFLLIMMFRIVLSRVCMM